MYCETGWKKKRPDLTQKEYQDWAQTGDGKAINEMWTDNIIDHRKSAGANARFSTKLINSWTYEPPVTLKRKTAEETQLVEPRDVWVTESDYMKDHAGAKPSDHGIQCE